MDGVLIDKITREILQRGTYPRFDGAPIEDMDPGLEWLIDYIPYPEESYDYDPRYFKINRSENTSAGLGDHPDYPGVGQFLITFQLIKNNEEEILLALESAKNLANSSVMPYDVQLEKYNYLNRGTL